MAITNKNFAKALEAHKEISGKIQSIAKPKRNKELKKYIDDAITALTQARELSRYTGVDPISKHLNSALESVDIADAYFYRMINE